MFRGINAINLDSKGRFSIPSRYVEMLEQETDTRLIVTIDTDSPCLLLYPFPEWEIIEQKLQALPSFNQAARRIQRLLIGHATDLELDSQRRILIPPLLRDYAALEKKTMLVGQGRKFGIWSELNWLSHREVWLAQEQETTTLPEQLQELSL